MIQLSEFFGKSITYMAYANGATLICQGVGNLLWMPLAVKYGRRPVYLTSNFLMGAACIWLAIAAEKTYTPFIIGRAFLGLFEAPIEAIVPSTVTDIFYLHERGEKISIYGLGVLGGNEIGPLVSAFIIQTLSMRWAFFIVAISIFINQFTLIFSMPETKFNGARPRITIHGKEKDEKVSTDDASKINVNYLENTSEAPAEAPKIPQRTYLQSISFCPSIDHSVSLPKTFLRPFVLMAYPTVLWSSVIYGLSLGWNVVLGVSVAQLFAPP
jgi:MFS family permease